MTRMSLRSCGLRAALPRIADGPGAGVSLRVAGELAVELADERDAVGEAQLGAAGLGPLIQWGAQASRPRKVSTAPRSTSATWSKRARSSLLVSLPVREL